MAKKYARKKRVYRKKRTAKKSKIAKVVRKQISKYTHPKPYTSSLPAFPAQRVVKMRWEKVYPAPNIGSGGDQFYQQIRCVSPRDPDYESVPTDYSAMGFVLYSTLYQHYLVKSAKITVTFTIPGFTTTQPYQGALCLFLALRSTDSSEDENFQKVTQNGLCRYRIFTLGSNAQKYTLTGVYNPRRFFQITDVNDNMMRLGSAMGSDPVEDAFWRCGVVRVANHNGDQPEIDMNIQMIVRVDYNVLCTEPKMQNPDM